MPPTSRPLRLDTFLAAVRQALPVSEGGAADERQRFDEVAFHLLQRARAVERIHFHYLRTPYTPRIQGLLRTVSPLEDAQTRRDLDALGEYAPPDAALDPIWTTGLDSAGVYKAFREATKARKKFYEDAHAGLAREAVQRLCYFLRRLEPPSDQLLDSEETFARVDWHSGEAYRALNAACRSQTAAPEAKWFLWCIQIHSILVPTKGLSSIMELAAQGYRTTRMAWVETFAQSVADTRSLVMVDQDGELGVADGAFQAARCLVGSLPKLTAEDDLKRMLLVPKRAQTPSTRPEEIDRRDLLAEHGYSWERIKEAHIRTPARVGEEGEAAEGAASGAPDPMAVLLSTIHYRQRVNERLLELATADLAAELDTEIGGLLDKVAEMTRTTTEGIAAAAALAAMAMRALVEAVEALQRADWSEAERGRAVRALRPLRQLEGSVLGLRMGAPAAEPTARREALEQLALRCHSPIVKQGEALLDGVLETLWAGLPEAVLKLVAEAASAVKTLAETLSESSIDRHWLLLYRLADQYQFVEAGSAGSVEPTSDIDTNLKGFRTDRVMYHYNRRFREEWHGFESGFVFDINTYAQDYVELNRVRLVDEDSHSQLDLRQDGLFQTAMQEQADRIADLQRQHSALKLVAMMVSADGVRFEISGSRDGTRQPLDAWTYFLDLQEDHALGEAAQQALDLADETMEALSRLKAALQDPNIDRSAVEAVHAEFAAATRRTDQATQLMSRRLRASNHAVHAAAARVWFGSPTDGTGSAGSFLREQLTIAEGDLRSQWAQLAPTPGASFPYEPNEPALHAAVRMRVEADAYMSAARLVQECREALWDAMHPFEEFRLLAVRPGHPMEMSRFDTVSPVMQPVPPPGVETEVQFDPIPAGSLAEFDQAAFVRAIAPSLASAARAHEGAQAKASRSRRAPTQAELREPMHEDLVAARYNAVLVRLYECVGIATMYANETDYTRGTVRHVVVGSQMKQGPVLHLNDVLASAREQVGNVFRATRHGLDAQHGREVDHLELLDFVCENAAKYLARFLMAAQRVLDVIITYGPRGDSDSSAIELFEHLEQLTFPLLNLNLGLKKPEELTSSTYWRARALVQLPELDDLKSDPAARTLARRLLVVEGLRSIPTDLIPTALAAREAAETGQQDVRHVAAWLIETLACLERVAAEFYTANPDVLSLKPPPAAFSTRSRAV